MISRETILKAWPLRAYLEKQGRELKPAGKEFTCRCVLHDDKNPSMSVNLEKEVWMCHVCGVGGTVIDLIMRQRSLSVKEALKVMAEEAGITDDNAGKLVKTATYDYRDNLNRPVMKVDRLEQDGKKRFVQYREADDKVVKNIEGVQRVLYRMEKWGSEYEVSLVEGEKCVHAMEYLGQLATTNPGGSGGWLPAYAMYLKGKHVNIWPDNDEPGEKWLETVVSSLEGKVESLRVMKVPAEYGDIADLVIARGKELATEFVMETMMNTPRIDKGVMISLLSAAECWDLYQKRLQMSETEGVDLSKWLPSMRNYSRVLMPGDMGLILADTGTGKTSLMVNIAISQAPLPVIFFEIELSPEPMAERFTARCHGVPTLSIEQNVKKGRRYKVDDWNHVFLCPLSRISIEDMEQVISKSELKIGRRPALILVDYVGLIGGAKGKPYERMSIIAESLKIMARATNTVVIAASQVKRDENRDEIGLHDGRDSSSLENSAQLVIGAWRTDVDKMTLKLLKQTKAAGHPVIECVFDGDRQRIEEAPYENKSY